MRIGTTLSDMGVQDVQQAVERITGAGSFATLWMPQIFGYDTLTLLAAAGPSLPGVELGTAVVPIHPRHPTALAAQALTVNELLGGRLTLGIGLSHKVVVEGAWGCSYAEPAAYMAEYLTVLDALLHNKRVEFRGRHFRVRAELSLPSSAPRPQVLLAAMGPKMLELAGRAADGTILWMTGPRTVGSHIRPLLAEAAERAGRPAPRIVVGLPICVTDDVARAKQQADVMWEIYGTLPSYRAMLDHEGASTPGDIAILGDEPSVTAQLDALAELGATDFQAAVFGDRDEVGRTLALLAARSGG